MSTYSSIRGDLDGTPLRDIVEDLGIEAFAEGWIRTAAGGDVREDIDRFHPYESAARVLEGGRRASMARLVNAWEWHERTADGSPQGGENPYAHPEGWVNVFGPDWVDGFGHRRPGSWDFTIRVVFGPNTRRWYVVKCEPIHLPAKAYQARLREVGIERTIPRRMRPNPCTCKPVRTGCAKHGRYELPWLWMEPLEMFPQGFADGFDLSLSSDTDVDDAIRAAKAWAAELRHDWMVEEDGYGGGQEILVAPERMLAFERIAGGDDGTAAIEAVIDAVAAMDAVGDEQ